LEFFGPYCAVWVCVGELFEIDFVEWDDWFAIFVEVAKDRAVFILVDWFCVAFISEDIASVVPREYKLAAL
jgi:hypothetical protein